MARLAVAALAGLAFTLSGCGGGDSPEGGDTTASTSTSSPDTSSPDTSSPDTSSPDTSSPYTFLPSTPTPSTSTPTPTPSTASTTLPPTPATTPIPSPTPPGDKKPLYIVMRMDDISPVDHAQVQADVIGWFSENKVKFNFGVIVGSDPTDKWSPYWPRTCAQNPGDLYCDDIAVRRVQKAYDDGDILGTSQHAVLEMGNHAWDHNNWARQLEVQEEDFQKSQNALKQLFPKATVRYFAAPENIANAETMGKMKAQGLDILSAAATRGCGGGDDPAAAWYLTSPCQYGGKATCKPAGDIWATTDGFAKVDGVWPAPAGSANSDWAGGGQGGITVDEALGVGDCGCLTSGKKDSLKVWCSVVASAKNNAAKSNGLHWTVHMMHPETVFPNGQSYTHWLDEFHQKAMALDEYEVHFINFQDLVKLSAPGSEELQLV